MKVHIIPPEDDEDLAEVFAGLEVTTLADRPAGKRACPGCDAVYDGPACPGCGLRYRPRCGDCGSRLVWSADAARCPSCGLPTPRRLFFVDPPPAPAPSVPPPVRES